MWALPELLLGLLPAALLARLRAAVALALVAMLWAAGGAEGVAQEERVSHSAQSRPAAVNVAILDFRVAGDADFLGAALAQALIIKLTGTEGLQVLERAQVQTLLLAAGSPELPTAGMLGAQYLITGQVQLAGAWPEPATRLRVSCRLLNAASAQVSGDASFVRDATVAEWFQLQDELALWVAAATGRQISAMQAQLRESRTLEAERLYGLALLQFGRAMQAQAGREFARGGQLCEESVRLARSALGNNANAFFSGAHALEQQARELGARCLEQDGRGAEAQQWRAQTVRQFTADAQQATVAFFDLARARQAAGDFLGAAAGYADYLAWAAAGARSFLGKRALLNGLFGEDAPGWYDNGTWADSEAPPLVPLIRDGDRAYVLAGQDELVCVSSDLRQERWRIPCPGLRQRCLVARGERLYMVTDDKQVLVLERDSGRVLRRLRIPLDGELLPVWRLFVFPDCDRLLVVSRHHMMAFSLSDDSRLEPVFQCDWINGGNQLRPIAYAQHGESLYLIGCAWRTFLQLNVRTGTPKEIPLMKVNHSRSGEGGQQIWPAADHLLVRYRYGNNDHYFRYFPATDSSVKAEEPLQGNAFLPRVPADARRRLVPVVDRKSGLYRLLNGALVLPYTCGEDLAGKDALLAGRLCGVSLEGNHLWLAARQQLTLLQVDSEQLLWRKRIAGMGGAVIGDGMTAYVFREQAAERHQAVFTLADQLVEKALTAQAHCYWKLGRIADALGSVEAALQENGSSPQALVLRGDIAQAMEDRDRAVISYEQALWNAPGGSEEQARAQHWLRRRLGLSACHYAGRYEQVTPSAHGVWAETVNAAGGTTLRFLPDDAQQTPALELDSPGVWCARGQRLLAIAPAARVGELTGHTPDGAAGLYEASLQPAQDGRRKWGYRLLGPAALPAGERPKLALCSGSEQVLVCIGDDACAGYRADTGALLWTRPGTRVIAAASDDTAIYTLHGSEQDDLRVRVLEAATGAVRWERDVQFGSESSSPTVSFDLLLLEGAACVFRFDGAPRWYASVAILPASNASAPEKEPTEVRVDGAEGLYRDGGWMARNVLRMAAGFDGPGGGWQTHRVLTLKGLLRGHSVDEFDCSGADLREEEPRRLARLQGLQTVRRLRDPGEIAEEMNRLLRRGEPEGDEFVAAAGWLVQDLRYGNDDALRNLQDRIRENYPSTYFGGRRGLLTYVGGQLGESTLVYPPRDCPLNRQAYSVPIDGLPGKGWRLAASACPDATGLSLLPPQGAGRPLHPLRLALPTGGNVNLLRLEGDTLTLGNSAGYLYRYRWPVLCNELARGLERREGCFVSGGLAGQDYMAVLGGSLPAEGCSAFLPRSTAEISSLPDLPDPPASSAKGRDVQAGGESAAGGEEDADARMDGSADDALAPEEAAGQNSGGAVARQSAGMSGLQLRPGDFAGVDYAFGQWISSVQIISREEVAAGALWLECSQRSEAGEVELVLELPALTPGENRIPLPAPRYARYWRLLAANHVAPGTDRTSQQPQYHPTKEPAAEQAQPEAVGDPVVARLEGITFRRHIFAPPAGSGGGAGQGWQIHLREAGQGERVLRSNECKVPLERTGDRAQAQAEGVLRVERAGEYELTLWAAGDTALTLDGVTLQPLGGSPGWHPLRQLLLLEAGDHPVRVEYRQTGRFRGLRLQLAAPAGIIPAYYFVRKGEQP